MKEILKPIFELLTGDFALFGNVVYNYIAMTIVGLVAFGVAFRFVRSLYDIGAISGRSSGSFIHWAVRLVAFVIVFYIFSAMIWAIKFIHSAVVWLVAFVGSIPWWTWVIIGTAIVLPIGLLTLVKARNMRSITAVTPTEEV